MSAIHLLNVADGLVTSTYSWLTKFERSCQAS
jgi:hypothetical protein